jgi:hypothetical protein
MEGTQIDLQAGMSVKQEILLDPIVTESKGIILCREVCMRS